MTINEIFLKIPTENNFKSEKMVKRAQFKKLYEISVVLKNAAEAFEAGDFLNIFLRTLGY